MSQYVYLCHNTVMCIYVTTLLICLFMTHKGFVYLCHNTVMCTYVTTWVYMCIYVTTHLLRRPHDECLTDIKICRDFK